VCFSSRALNMEKTKGCNWITVLAYGGSGGKERRGVAGTSESGAIICTWVTKYLTYTNFISKERWLPLQWDGCRLFPSLMLDSPCIIIALVVVVF